MVILKLTKPVSSELESEVIDLNLNSETILVRPCERYKELLSNCKSIRGRLHQFYVYGELFDCQDHKDNYAACLKYRRSNDLSLLDSVIAWEKNLMVTRVNAERQNKTWKFRDSPPDDFTAPLPEHIAARQRDSLFR